MLDAGFLDEVRALRANGALSLSNSAIRSVGYRQAWECLDGLYDYATFKSKAVIATRQLAKRQCTWFNKWPGKGNIVVKTPAEALKSALQVLGNAVQ